MHVCFLPKCTDKKKNSGCRDSKAKAEQRPSLEWRGKSKAKAQLTRISSAASSPNQCSKPPGQKGQGTLSHAAGEPAEGAGCSCVQGLVHWLLPPPRRGLRDEALSASQYQASAEEPLLSRPGPWQRAPRSRDPCRGRDTEGPTRGRGHRAGLKVAGAGRPQLGGTT